MKSNTIEDILSNINKTKEGCWEWNKSLTHNGYGLCAYRGKQYRVHRLVYSALKETIEEGLSVLHHCDNPKCCNPDHLFLGTQQDNISDMKAKGRGASGLTHGRYTKPFSQETKDKISKSAKAKSRELYKEMGRLSGIARAGKKRGPYKLSRVEENPQPHNPEEG